MNREALYLEIGNIDDELICEAENAGRHKNYRKYITYFSGIAACLCLICGGILYGTKRDVIHYNTATISVSSKVFIPEGATVRTLSYTELLAYYGISELPDALGKLSKAERSKFFVYEKDGELLFDENTLQYASLDGQQALTVTIATDEYCVASDKNAKKSRIDGVSVVLAASESTVGKSGQQLYRAEFCNRGIYIRVVSVGMNEENFILTLRELIQSQK